MKRALLVVDMQNDFMPGGALGVPGGDQIVPIINHLMTLFPLVAACVDWHPANHCSFVTQHPGKKAGDKVVVGKLEQILWPVHCVQDTHGAELVSTLKYERISGVFPKGTDPMVDGYSAFYDNAHQKSTGLGEALKQQGVEEIYIAGLATDYCVLYSAFDAAGMGFKVVVVRDACRPINLGPDDERNALMAIAAVGAKIVSAKEIR